MADITGKLRSRRKPDLNLVLCGSTENQNALYKCFREEETLSSSHQREYRSLCVMEKKPHGRRITLVKLPALSRLSEEDVMRQTLHCMTLCDPGVHAFIVIVNVSSLNHEDRAEIAKIQRAFDSREHFMVLFINKLINSKSVIDLVESSPESQSLISHCGGRHKLMELQEPENPRQIPDLLDFIENMNSEPYSLLMYVKAQENRARRETEEKYEEELKRIEDKIKAFRIGGAEGVADPECLRIVLIGKTGNGKSATGNTILGREEFHSELSTDSVTTACLKRVGDIDGQSVAVVDTPGLFDTTLTKEEVAGEIMKCVSLSSPGPHVFLIVLSLGRITNEEMETLDLIKKIFGPKSAPFSIVLFTKGDQLDNLTIQEYLKRSKSEELKKLIRDCGDRYVVFNNKEKEDRTQVIQLLEMIEEVKKNNQGRYFSNSMFEETEMNIKKRMEEILKKMEREIQSEKEKTENKYEIEMKNMKRFEEEKQRADEERVKMEDQMRKERREKAEKMMECLERLMSEIDSMRQKHEEMMKRIKMKYEADARRKAEECNEINEQQILDINDKLEGDNDKQELLKEFNDLLKDKKWKKWKNKGCVIA